MTIKSRILSLALSVLMIAALFAPIGLVFAEDNLLIVRANDNGGTTATSTAKEAIPGLGSGTTWYSANRNQITENPDKIAKADYTLAQTASVSAVKIAFYFADQRSYEFSIEYSMNGETWNTALAKTNSSKLAADKTAETFTFPSAVDARYLRVSIYSGTGTNYAAFYTFEAIGTFDTTSELQPADVSALEEAFAKFGDLDPEEYDEDDYTRMSALVESYEELLDATCLQQAEVDAAVALILKELKDFAPSGQVYVMDAYQTEGPLHTNSIYHATAACPNLRADGEVWFSANASGDNTVAAVFLFPIEVELSWVELDWYEGESRFYEFALYTSIDGREWTEVVEPGTFSDDVVSVVDVEDSVLYVKIVSEEGWADGSNPNHWIALDEIRFYGEFVEDGRKPAADYTVFDNWVAIYSDLHPELYTDESWAEFEGLIENVDYTISYDEQDVLDEYVADVKAAYTALEFLGIEDGIRISHSHWSEGEYATGDVAWTFGSILFTEPGYSLHQYKVTTMGLANWYRIIAEPTAEVGVYKVVNIYEPGTTVTADEAVPENEFGTGFALAFYTLNENGVDDGDQSQYAAVEFGLRNEAAWQALELVPGDLVQLNNVLFTDDDFINEGEVYEDEDGNVFVIRQAAWLETEGTWKHRYWTDENLGAFTPTIINRQSNKKDIDGNYVSRDEFDGFESYSTLTKVEVEANYVPGDVNGNGEVDPQDLVTLAKYLADWDVELDAVASDVNGNGEVDPQDLVTLAKYLADWDVELLPGGSNL